jgi:hypothetical protein
MNWQVLCPICYLNPNFGPDEPISQAQVAVALVRVLLATNHVQLLGLDEADAVLDRFPDAGSLPATARLLVATAVNSGLIPLFHPNRLEPLATYSRIEGAVVLEVAKVRYFRTPVPSLPLPF